jgi:hypothetical protein
VSIGLEVGARLTRQPDSDDRAPRDDRLIACTAPRTATLGTVWTYHARTAVRVRACVEERPLGLPRGRSRPTRAVDVTGPPKWSLPFESFPSSRRLKRECMHAASERVSERLFG